MCVFMTVLKYRRGKGLEMDHVRLRPVQSASRTLHVIVNA